MINDKLSDGWTWVIIGEIAENINPGFPSGRHNQENLGIPHLRPMNISRNGDIDLSLVKYVEPDNYSPLLQGDVLFNNTNSPELVGKTTYIRKDTNWAYSNHMTRIRLNKEIAYPGWVANALHYLFLDGFFKKNCRHHVNQASIGSGFLSQNVKIPLPPLSEQERIVAKIEELFTQLDAGTSALERVQAGLRRYKASVLKAAVEGRLVNGNSEFGEGELPERWRWSTVAELAAKEPNSITDGPFGSKLKTEHYRESGPRVIRLQNIGDGEFRDEKAYISREHFESLRKHQIFAGDLVIAGLGESLPRACLIPEYVGDAIVKADCIRFKPNTELADNRYLLSALNSETVKKLVARVVHGVGRPRMNQQEIKSIPIPIAPLEEQRRIVAEVERRLSVARQVEAAVEEALVRASRLRQAVLKSAFEGRLV